MGWAKYHEDIIEDSNVDLHYMGGGSTKTNTVPLTFKCNYCNAAFSSKEDLDAHICDKYKRLGLIREVDNFNVERFDETMDVDKNFTGYIQEDFTFINELAFYRGKVGFQVYNSKGENIGLVFMCEDARSSAYKHCELCMYEKYQKRYGSWYRIQSHGKRIRWTTIVAILQNVDKYHIYID